MIRAVLICLSLALCCYGSPFPRTMYKPYQPKQRVDKCLKVDDTNLANKTISNAAFEKIADDLVKSNKNSSVKVTKTKKDGIIIIDLQSSTASSDKKKYALFSGANGGACAERINLGLMINWVNLCKTDKANKVCKSIVSLIPKANPKASEFFAKAKPAFSKTCTKVPVIKDLLPQTTCTPKSYKEEDSSTKVLDGVIKGKTQGIINIVQGYGNLSDTYSIVVPATDIKNNLRRYKASTAIAYLLYKNVTVRQDNYMLHHKLAHGSFMDNYMTSDTKNHEFTFMVTCMEKSDAIHEQNVIDAIFNLIYSDTKQTVATKAEKEKALETIKEKTNGDFTSQTTMTQAIDILSSSQGVKMEVSATSMKTDFGIPYKIIVVKPFKRPNAQKKRVVEHKEIFILGGAEVAITLMEKLATVGNAKMKLMVYNMIHDPNPNAGYGATKNAMEDPKKFCEGSKAGVHFMSNFPTKNFKNGTDPCSPRYPGKEAGSARETQIIIDVVGNLKKPYILMDIVYNLERCDKPTIFYTKPELKAKMEKVKAKLTKIELKQEDYSGNFVTYYTEESPKAMVFTYCVGKDISTRVTAIADSILQVLTEIVKQD